MILKKRCRCQWGIRFTITALMVLSLFLPGFAAETEDGTGTWISLADSQSGKKKGASDEPAVMVSRSDADKLVLKMQTPGFYQNTEEVGGRLFQSLHMGRYNGDLAAGQPNLPTLRRYIYIPNGKTPKLTVDKGTAITLTGYDIFPMQHPKPNTVGAEVPEFVVDDATYKSNRVYPSKMVFLDTCDIIRGHRVALLHICPFEYNPQTKVLNAYPQIQVDITFEGVSQVVDKRLDSDQFNKFVKGFITNPEAFSRYGTPAVSIDSDGQDSNGKASDVPAAGEEFLIITPPAFVTAANTLRDHRIAGGMSTIVVTTDVTGSTKDEIQAYIQNAYDTWSPAPTYVLLLGDVEFIPAIYLIPAFRATDLYYATVDGSDYKPDIFLGRISVDTAAQAETFVQKIIMYENDPPSRESFYATAAAVTCYYGDDHETCRFVKTSEVIRDFLLTQGYLTTRIYIKETDSTPTYYNDGNYGNGEPLPEELLEVNGFTWDGDAVDIKNTIDSGAFMVMFNGLGMDRNDGGVHTGWYAPYFIENDLHTLLNNDRLPVVFSMASDTGWFDGETDQNTNRSFESFGEIFLRKGMGCGAIAVICSTGTSDLGFSDSLAEGLIDCVWPDFLPAVPNNAGASARLGHMLNHGKMTMAMFWGGDTWSWILQRHFERYHVLGDPSLEMWTQKPGGPGTQTLRVESIAAAAVPITVDTADLYGNSSGDSNFSRIYHTGTVVSITAPAVHNSAPFLKWTVNGIDDTNLTIQVTMDEYREAHAVYESKYTLDVQSSTATAVAISVIPNDTSGNGDGTTNFSREYHRGTIVTLTAPETYNSDLLFVKWTVNGVDDTNRTIQVTIDEDHTATVVYSPTVELNVTSPTSYTRVDVSPGDVNGQANDATDFKRNFYTGTVVTLSVLLTDEGLAFAKWMLDDVDYSTDRTIQVAMDEDHCASVYYSPYHTLDVQSIHVDSVPVSVSVGDIYGNSNGDTSFRRFYLEGTVVTLTAPATHNGRPFKNWDVNGTVTETLDIQVTMNQASTAAALYGTLPDQHNILVVNLSNSSWPGYNMKSHVEDAGKSCDLLRAIPSLADILQYDCVFITMEGSHVLSSEEGDVLKAYLDAGGALYMEDGSTWSSDPQTSVHPYFGIKGNDYVYLSGTYKMKGIAGTFTNALNCGFWGGWGYHLEVADGVTDAFPIWRVYAPQSYNSGIARDTGNYRTIGVSEDFHDYLQTCSDPVMHVYLDFLLGPGAFPNKYPHVDLNGDGHPDLVWRNTSTGQNGVWFMNGTTRIGQQFLNSSSNTDWEIGGLGDFNGDSKADLFWRNKTTGENALWFLDGTTRTGIVYLNPLTNTDWVCGGVGDLNSDGKTDIFWRNKVTGENTIWYMDGTVRSEIISMKSLTDINWECCGLGDFNADGRADIFWRNKVTGENGVWNLKSTDHPYITLLKTLGDLDWICAGIMDVNGDSRADILWRHKTTGQNAVWYMKYAAYLGNAYFNTLGKTEWILVN